MPRFLWRASYTADGFKGVLKEGGSGRRAAIEQMIEGLGGRVEAFYFALGEDDSYVIFDVPDNLSAVAGSLAVNSTGAAHAKTVPLLTPEELDEATRRSAQYRPPGG